jgi:hypothetical protein
MLAISLGDLAECELAAKVDGLPTINFVLNISRLCRRFTSARKRLGKR